MGVLWGNKQLGVTHPVWAEEKQSSVPVLSLHSPLSETDSIHTLTCAIMLLNTDLHGQVSGWGAHLWDLRQGPGQGVEEGD